MCKKQFAAKRRDAKACSRTCRWRKNHSYLYRYGKKYDPTVNLPWYRKKLSGNNDT